MFLFLPRSLPLDHPFRFLPTVLNLAVLSDASRSPTLRARPEVMARASDGAESDDARAAAPVAPPPRTHCTALRQGQPSFISDGAGVSPTISFATSGCETIARWPEDFDDADSSCGSELPPASGGRASSSVATATTKAKTSRPGHLRRLRSGGSQGLLNGVEDSQDGINARGEVVLQSSLRFSDQPLASTNRWPAPV